MRKIAGTAAVIASIALVIVLLFMAPKGFELSAPNPLVSSDTSAAPPQIEEIAPTEKR